MSRRPVGRDVYWRRRLLVLAIAIGLVWVALQVVGLVRGDDEPADETKPASPSARATATAEPTTTPTKEPPADQVSVALETSTDECKPENVRIIPSIAPEQEAGGPVMIDLLLSTLDGTACTFRPSSDQLLAVVDTDRAPVYDSSVCRAAFFDQAVAIPEGWGTVTTVEWSGRGSGTGCSTSEGFAPPGTYTLKIGTYGGEPGEVTFSLARRAPDVAPTTAPPSAAPTTAPAPTTQPTARRPKAPSTAAAGD